MWRAWDPAQRLRKSVSVPEKTLEHWSSHYLTYRNRSKVALWWPASGEDIRVGWLPARPGKIVQLELRTTTVVSPTLHDVKIDLRQLWEYRQRPIGYRTCSVTVHTCAAGGCTRGSMPGERLSPTVRAVVRKRCWDSKLGGDVTQSRAYRPGPRMPFLTPEGVIPVTMTIPIMLAGTERRLFLAERRLNGPAEGWAANDGDQL
jgi:hypothetical protein